MADILPFTRTPVRAIVIVPADDPATDVCRAVLGGFPLHGGETFFARGSLKGVLRRCQWERQGLPITVHPECERRAANERTREY